MASDPESEQEHAPTTAPVGQSHPLDIFATDDRLLALERASRTHSRHLSQLEGSLSTQMVALTVLEVVFALFLAITLWVEYRRKTESEVRRGTH